MASSLTLVDLFCGAGGFTQGALRIPGGNIRVLCGVDSDPICEQTWQENLPDVPFLRESLSPDNLGVVWLRAAEAGAVAGSVDILVASPPCQRLSAAGKRDALDPLNELYASALLAVERWRPRAFVLENVPQFFSAASGSFLAACQGALARFGYRTAWRVLDAASFGVPQHRRRGFLVAVLDGSRTLELLPRATHRSPRATKQAYAPLPLTPTAGDAIGDLPPLAAGEGLEPAHLGEPLSSYQRARRATGTQAVYNHLAWNHSPAMVERIRSLLEGETPQSFAEHPLKSRTYFRGAYSRLRSDLPSGTVTTNFHNPGSGRFTHYRDDRTLTVREAARLQSFDDCFRFLGTRSQAGRLVGNAVPPLLASAVLGAVCDALGLARSEPCAQQASD